MSIYQLAWNVEALSTSSEDCPSLCECTGGPKTMVKMTTMVMSSSQSSSCVCACVDVWLGCLVVGLFGKLEWGWVVCFNCLLAAPTALLVAHCHAMFSMKIDSIHGLIRAVHGLGPTAGQTSPLTLPLPWPLPLPCSPLPFLPLLPLPLFPLPSTSPFASCCRSLMTHSLS